MTTVAFSVISRLALVAALCTLSPFFYCLSVSFFLRVFVVVCVHLFSLSLGRGCSSFMHVVFAEGWFDAQRNVRLAVLDDAKTALRNNDKARCVRFVCVFYV